MSKTGRKRRRSQKILREKMRGGGKERKRKSGKAVCEEGRLEFIWFLILMERAVVTRPVRLRVHSPPPRPQTQERILVIPLCSFKVHTGMQNCPQADKDYFFLTWCWRSRLELREQESYESLGGFCIPVCIVHVH